MRTNAAYYLKGIPGTKELKVKIFKSETKEEIISLLDNFLLNDKEMWIYELYWYDKWYWG